MADIYVWRCRNEDTLKTAYVRIPKGEIPSARVFEWEGQRYRRDALVDVEHGNKIRGGEVVPEALIQRDITDVVGWQYDQWDPAFEKFDTNPDSPSYGHPVFGSRDDVRRGLRSLQERGLEVEYGDGLSRIRP